MNNKNPLNESKPMDGPLMSNIKALSSLSSFHTPIVNEPKHKGIGKLLMQLNMEWEKVEAERSKWIVEKSELQTRMSVLEGQIMSYASVNLELVERIKMLESALLLARSQEKFGNETVVPDKIQPAIEKPTKTFTNKQAIRGRHLLQQYLKETKVIDSIIESKGRNNIMQDDNKLLNDLRESSSKSLPKIWKQPPSLTKYDSPHFTQKRLNHDEESEIINILRQGYKERSASRYISVFSDSSVAEKYKNMFDMLRVDDPSQDSEDKNYMMNELDVIEDGSKKVTNSNIDLIENSLTHNIIDSGSSAVDKSEDSLSDDLDIGILADLNDIIKMTDDKVDLGSRVRSETILSENQKLWATSKVLRGHTDIVRQTRFHPTKSCLATVSDDSLVCLWKYDTWNKIDLSPSFILRGHKSPVLSCEFSSIGDCLFTADLNGCIIVWNILNNNEILQTYNSRCQPIYSLSYSDKSKRLLSSSAEGVCNFWKADKVSPLTTFHIKVDTSLPSGLISGTYFPTDHSKVVCCHGNTITFFDAIAEKIIFEHKEETEIPEVPYMLSSVPHPTSSLLATGWSDKMIKILDVNSKKFTESFIAHSDAVTALSYDSHGTVLASGGKTYIECVALLLLAANGIIHFWNTNYSCYQELTSHRVKGNSGVTSLEFHKKLSQLVSSGADEIVKLYI